MKKIKAICTVFAFMPGLIFGQTMKGEIVEQLEFKGLINSAEPEISIDKLKGKIVILEFWATWCGPCIPAMDHLISLKQDNTAELEIIGITYDTPERINKYIKNKPSDIIFVSDLEDKYKKVFPHTSIPHTVIIDKNGRFIAETSPKYLTKDVVETLLSTNKFIGKQKSVVNREGFDYSHDYFPPDDNESERFLLQPPLSNGFPMVKRFNKGEYQNRRITFINSSIINILRHAFDLSTEDTYRLDGIEMDYLTSTLYCLDVIVPKGQNIKELMRDRLQDAFPEIKIDSEKRIIEVLELKTIPGKEITLISADDSNSISNNNITRVSSYKKSNVSLDDFTNDYLNKFITPILTKPIINATNLNGFYNIDFSFELEDPESFKRELSNLGLRLQSEKKEIETLVISSNN